MRSMLCVALVLVEGCASPAASNDPPAPADAAMLLDVGALCHAGRVLVDGVCVDVPVDLAVVVPRDMTRPPDLAVPPDLLPSPCPKAAGCSCAAHAQCRVADDCCSRSPGLFGNWAACVGSSCCYVGGAFCFDDSDCCIGGVGACHSLPKTDAGAVTSRGLCCLGAMNQCDNANGNQWAAIGCCAGLQCTLKMNGATYCQ